MENSFHILDDGFKAQCIDANGVVSQAKMDIYAAVNGELADQSNAGGYTAVTLRPGLEYLRAGSTSGSCKLTICLPQGEFQAGKEFQCDQRPSQVKGISPDPSRPFEIKQMQVSYSVSGKDIALTVKTSFSLFP